MVVFHLAEAAAVDRHLEKLGIFMRSRLLLMLYMARCPARVTKSNHSPVIIFIHSSGEVEGALVVKVGLAAEKILTHMLNQRTMKLVTVLTMKALMNS